MRILALTRYAPLGSSSRVRFHQYHPYLRAQGVDIQTAALPGDEYVPRLMEATDRAFFGCAGIPATGGLAL
jgi:hypothetical protein